MTETVAAILANRKKSHKTDFQKGLGKLRKIDHLLDRLLAAAVAAENNLTDDQWELIYSAIFSKDPDDIQPKAFAALELTGFSFPDYYDPDTTYEADARAWIEAFKEVLARVEARAVAGDDEY